MFVRTSRHVELTSAGQLLLDGSRKLLGDAERLAWRIQDAGRTTDRPLVVGFQANAAAELTPKILSAFHDLHPRVDVEMRSHGFTDPHVGLADGSVDVAFVRPPVLVQDWLAIEPLFVEPRVLVVASTSPLAQLDEVSVEQLLDEPFVARKSPDAWRSFWLATDSRQGMPVRLGAEASTVDECFEAILAERGVAFSQASTRRFYDRPGLAFVPVSDIPPTMLSIAWRRDVDSPTVRDFVETARAVTSLHPIPDAWVPDRLRDGRSARVERARDTDVTALRRAQ